MTMAQTTSTTTFAPWAQPYAEGYLQRAQQVADQPYQGFQGQRVAGFVPWQQQGLDAMASRAVQGSPLLAQAQQSAMSMMQPGTNPYLQPTIDAAQQDVVRNWNTVQMPQFDTAMSRGGSFGNAGVGQVTSQAASDLQRNLGRISTDMRMQDYGAQQNRVLQALGMAPALAQADYGDIDRLMAAGGAAQGQNQRLLDDAYSRFVESRDFPSQQLNIMGNALGRVGGSATTNNAADPSSAAQAIGGALTFAQLWKLLGG